MYSRRKVDYKLDLAEKKFGWRAVQHSVADVIGFEDHLKRHQKYTYDEVGMPDGVQNITPDEAKWMLNDQVLCTCDAEYYLTRFCFLKNQDNIIERFQFRVPQKLYFDIICDLEERDAAIEILALKARQLGVSIFSELLISQRIVFSYGVISVIGSADQTKTSEMSQMLILAYDMLPVWLRPSTTSRVESDRGKLMFGGTASGVRFQHGQQKFGIGTGSTPTLYHLCLSGRTLVRVSDSCLRPIREIVAGDSTITRTGAKVPVLRAWKSPRNNELTSEIHVWGTPTALSCTRDHRVLIDEGWKEAKDVHKGDYLTYPVRPITVPKKIPIKIYQKWSKIGNPRMVSVDFPASFALGRLAGLYLAEGTLPKTPNKLINCVVFCLHRDETNIVEKWCREVFGEELRQTQKRKTSKTALVCLNRRGFGEWLLANFGEKDDKRVSDICWEHGEDFARGVVYGYLFGDGHFAERDNGIYATSVRSSLTFGLRELIASLGFGWSQIAYREAGNYYNRNCKAAWILTVAGETAKELRRMCGHSMREYKEPHSVHWKYGLDCGALSIQVEVEKVTDGLSEDFYDVEVAHESHSFLTACGIVHNSEVALYPDPVKIIDEGLWKAVHASPGVFGVLESTGRGSEGWWADTWRYSKSKWPNSRMAPMFLPWYTGTNIYPTPTDMRTRPVPIDWRPARDTREHVAKAQLFVQSSPLLSKHLGPDWRMPIEQQWYWEWNHEEAKFKGNEGSFYQEMAGDDEEALQRSSESVFGHEVIQVIETGRQHAYDCFTLTGQSIEDSHEVAPEHFDYTRERIPIVYQSHKNTSRWELIPLKQVKLNETNREDAESVLMVWEHPRPGINYAIGVDTSSGKGEDSSVVSVWALGYGAMPDVQVAEYASSWVSHVESFAFILCIAAYYAKYMGEGKTRWKEPYVTIEQVEAVGDVAQHQMGLLGYTNFHKMPRYDQSLRRIQKMKKGAAKPGWYTWGWSRPILIDSFVHWVKHGWAKVNSPWLIEEMRHFEVHLTARGKERLEHEDGENDDRIFGAALSVFPPHDVEPMSHRSKNRIEVASAMPKLDLSPYRANVVPAASLEDRNPTLTMDDLIYSSQRGRR